MKLSTSFLTDAAAVEVFDALHRYKISRDPKRFFPSRLVQWHFRVLTDHALGLGAVYDWKIWLLGIPVLAFQEQVVEWEEGKCVAYRAISGWEMDFHIDLKADGESTRVEVDTDLALPGPDFIHSLLRPAYELGLKRVCQSGLRKEGVL